MTRSRRSDRLPQTHAGNQTILVKLAANYRVPLSHVRYVFSTEHNGRQWTVRSDFEVLTAGVWRPVDWVGDADGMYG